MKNEDGHIFPMTIGIFLLCIMILTAYASSYIQEQRFRHDAKEFYLQETLMLAGVQYSLKKADYSDTQEILELPNGTISYKRTKKEKGIVNISITCKTLKGTEYTANFHYDLNNQQIMSWNEYS
ncbi:competence type IV pilus minor pilin ComGG [Aeribacillus composti]|uniref:Competence type IV pilus minor pilin ComGG n=1 Tax=Aeribacillus composti TaxID=1868734 RepID=A0ABY9W7I1_9BACI|nr:MULTISPECIES: competence type IV pilus minor pilin ComGG [Aeribacillus]KZM56810.1 hypothetical protein A3Q35_07135 [Aeribacillus pallidus]MDR9794385.1 competence type IV pilus minor pilin ComGG [Aeribacillus pallidus]MED0649666.1 competence type IV pilus minor pilin ComGG [Aeribacillus composti]MED0715476.1 competence type IV pilus minor pilin ComGG [Aeribacillus composti]MED0746151.1 competence type IV pilus minor pilin ComGG [Aeribacillus composti]